ncbi:gfo/Idh/MocA family oxidoreductase [Sesbania bispinosa]|nr:gfo/Idh/MocA family oxidoreductase [Sesbania bispinosa]
MHREDAFAAAPGGDYIPEEGPSGVADEDAPVVGDGAGVDFQDAYFEDNFDRIMRGD